MPKDDEIILESQVGSGDIGVEGSRVRDRPKKKWLWDGDTRKNYHVTVDTWSSGETRSFSWGWRVQRVSFLIG